MNAVKASEKLSSLVAPQFAESNTEGQALGLMPAGWSNSLLDMICAATINEGFCQKLLFRPDNAISGGFNGQRFSITKQELLHIRAVRATTLAGFIHQLEKRMVQR